MIEKEEREDIEEKDEDIADIELDEVDTTPGEDDGEEVIFGAEVTEEVEDLDGEESDDGEEKPDEESDDEEEKQEDKPEKTSQESLDEKENTNVAYNEAQATLASISEQFNDIDETVAAPEHPGEDATEDEMADYRTEVVIYKRDKRQVDKDKKKLVEKMTKYAKKCEAEFRKDFQDSDITGFEKWINDRPYFFSAWTTGSETLYSLYSVFLNRTGKLADAKKVKKLIKGKKVIKPVNLKSSTTPKGGSGPNGVPSKFKHANLPEFKEMVSDYKKRRYDIAGKPFTNEYINELCKQEYILNSGGSII